MTQNQIMQVFKEYQTAIFAKDVEAFLAIYDKDVYIFDMWENWSYNGIEAWRGMVTNWFGSLGNELVRVEFSDLEIIATDEMAIAHAIITFTGLSAERKELRSMQNRLTCALKNVKGTWKIIHQHTSSPLESSTLKAIFKKD